MDDEKMCAWLGRRLSPHFARMEIRRAGAEVAVHLTAADGSVCDPWIIVNHKPTKQYFIGRKNGQRLSLSLLAIELTADYDFVHQAWSVAMLSSEDSTTTILRE